MNPESIKPKLKIYSYIIIGLLSILVFKLAIIQLFNNETYQTQAKENRIRLMEIKATRGEIYARSGQTLATNKLVYTLSLTYIENQNYNELIDNLIKIIHPYYLEITEKDINNKISAQQSRLFEPIIIVRDIPWELVVELEENRADLPGLSIIVEPLRTYPYDSLAGHVLGYIHSIDQRELTEFAEEEYGINSLIGKSGIEKQYEKVLRGKDGARRVEVDARGRPIQELVTLEPIPGENLYLTIDLELQHVLDQSMQKILLELQKTYPKAKVGSAVVLNIKTGEVLAMTSLPALNPDDWKGNISTEKVSGYYFPQGAYNPLEPGAAINRAIQSTYPPGSTFKPVTGMAALEAGVMNPSKDYVRCDGRYWVAPYIKCTGVHGNVNLYSALAVSCNTYFQEMGRRATKEKLVDVGEQFGLGQKTGIDLPQESKGILPSPEWKTAVSTPIIEQKYDNRREQLEQKYKVLIENAADDKERESLVKAKANESALLEEEYRIDLNFNTAWQPFDTFNMSIGQGYNSFTVLQLANYTATIANGGSLMKPYIVSKIEDYQGQTVEQIKPVLMHRVDVKPDSIAEIKRAMLAVTQPGGTASFLFSDFPSEIRVAAKTGSAETGRAGDDPLKEVHGVFIAFAPFDDPEIAFAGVVEYGYSGGTSAGYVAKDVFEHYFKIKDHLAGQ